MKKLMLAFLVVLSFGCDPTPGKKIVFNSESFSLTYLDNNLIMDSVVIKKQGPKEGIVIFRTKLPSDKSALINKNILAFGGYNLESLLSDSTNYSVRFYGHDHELNFSYYFKTYYTPGDKFEITLLNKTAKPLRK